MIIPNQLHPVFQFQISQFLGSMFYAAEQEVNHPVVPALTSSGCGGNLEEMSHINSNKFRLVS